MKHFICKRCGNLVAAVNYTSNPLSCCSREMDELTPKADADRAKHLPKITVKGNTVSVKVGEDSSPHPQLPEHFVEWVCLVTDRGSQRKMLPPSGKPEVTFALTEGERPINAFAYCNMHGLWVSGAAE